MKNSNTIAPATNNATSIETKKSSRSRLIPAREMTLEQFRQVYFPELVGEIQASTTDAAAAPVRRNAA